MAQVENDTSVVPNTGLIIVSHPNCIVGRYQPVAARIFGGGTSSVLPSGAGGTVLPEGAVLISHTETGTSTSVF